MASMQSQENINGHATVLAEGDAIVLRNFRESDPVVVSLVGQSADREAAIHHCFAVGARIGPMIQTTAELELVKAAFGDFMTNVQGTAAETLAELKRTMTTFLAEDGGVLARTLQEGRGEFERFLDEHFDPESKRSVLGKVDALLERRAKATLREFNALLDPTDEKSPMGRYQAELLKGFRREFAGVREELVQIREQLAAEKAEKALLERTSLKGGNFNEDVHLAVSRIAAGHGDLAEMTNDVYGAAGTKAGDEVVTIDSADTGGLSARFVLENKTGKYGMGATVKELDAAMANREALAGVAVFGRLRSCPTGLPFSFNGTKAFVVYDREELDDRALWLAYWWARWTVRRELGSEHVGFDAERAGLLIEKGTAALAKVMPIKGFLTQATKKIGLADDHLDELVAEVDAVLRELRELLDSEG